MPALAADTRKQAGGKFQRKVIAHFTKEQTGDAAVTIREGDDKLHEKDFANFLKKNPSYKGKVDIMSYNGKYQTAYRIKHGVKDF